MPNRSLQVKFERSQRQVRELAHQEFSKAAYLAGSKDEARALLASLDMATLHVQRIAPGKADGLSKSIGTVGKGGRVRALRTYGNGERLLTKGLWMGCVT